MKSLKGIIHKNIKKISKNKNITITDYDGFVSNYNNILNAINEINIIDKLSVYNRIIQRFFNKEFNNQINNKFIKQNGKIELTIKGETYKITVKNNKVKASSYKVLTKSDSVYIDSPFILDKINEIENVFSFLLDYHNNLYTLSHTDDVKKKLQLNSDNKGVYGSIITEQKLQEVYDILNNMGIGKLVLKNGSFQYEAYNTKFELTNVSVGIKTYIILNTLLLNGSIKDDGCIILDEPEVHLHPEYQVKFAEIIVLLQKVFNLHILINTHSPYFLRAVEVYASKHSIADKCNYYLAQINEDNKTSDIKEVTKDLEQIYKLLAEPFNMLENMINE